ncbi:MAG: hypothetical protein HOQ44_05180, partial [Nocardia sp.]|nr:hypothetical protein [Nocardia sp.]
MPTEPIPVLRLPGWDSGNATYEGSWSDWVARTSGEAADTPPDAEPDLYTAPDPEPGTDPADTGDAAGHEPAATAEPSPPASARERLRRRLTPPEGSAPEPARATAPAPGRRRALPVLLGVHKDGAERGAQ